MITLVIDVKGWAFDRTADEMIKYLPFEVKKRYVQEFNDKPEFTEFTHFMNWLDGKELGDRVSGGVCSHNFEIRHKKQAKKKMPKMRALSTISKRLYTTISKYNNNVHYCPNGVDADMFTPTVNTGEFTVGWVGQPSSGGKKSTEGVISCDIKGYGSFLKPLLKRLKNVKFKILDLPYDKAMPHSEMPGWYRDIDVLICTSLYEGCPLPVLEASACGKTVVSTRVGIVPELLDDFIVYSVDEMAERLLFLKDNRDLCREVGAKNRQKIEKDWTWKKVVKNWEGFFK